MNIDSAQLREISSSIGDKIYIKVENWNLYLSDAGLADALAIECQANLEKGAVIASKRAVESLYVRLGGGDTQLPLIKLISSSQILDLEDILEPYCR